MVITAGVYVFESAGFMEVLLGVNPLEQEALNFIGRIQSVAFVFVELVGKGLQDAANIGGVRSSLFFNDVAENQHLARPEEVCRRPVERGPVDTQPQVALALRGESANRGAVE